MEYYICVLTMTVQLLHMCIDYDSGVMHYSTSGNMTSRPKMTISWLCPLKSLSDVDLRIIAQNYSTANGRQLWYFADFKTIIEEIKRGIAILIAMHWMVKDDKLGQYTFQALMEHDILQGYDILVEDLRDLVVDVGKAFVEKWKGFSYNNFKSQREHEGLILESVAQFIRNWFT